MDCRLKRNKNKPECKMKHSQSHIQNTGLPNKASQLKELKKNMAKHRTQLRKKQIEYLKAKAKQETTEKLSKLAKQKVLEKHKFTVAKENRDLGKPGTRIKRPINDCLMSDKDFTKYSKLFHKERTKLGIKVTGYTDSRGNKHPAWDTTSDYKTREKLQQAEKELINTGIKTTPKNFRKDLKKAKTMPHLRPKMIDLFMGVKTR